MRVIEVKLFQYDELNETAKAKARDWYGRYAFDHDWWSFTYEDAEQIGLKISSFDCYHREINGKIQTSVNEVVRKIRTEHGKSCGTYRLAKSIDLRKPNDRAEDMETFERALLQEYLKMLREEADYIESRESIEENIRANEYEFTEDGRRA